MHYGSGEVSFRAKPLSPPPVLSRLSMASKTSNVWNMNKKELMSYAEGLGVTYHESWTREEIRSVIQEFKEILERHPL